MMPDMPAAATFSILEPLRNGTQLEIRALRPSDRNGLLQALTRASDRSFYRRFFGVRREFSEAEVNGFVDIDFEQQVALVAVSHGNDREVIVAGARYIVTAAGTAEIALTVIDEYQRQGLAGVMLRHLAALAHAAGLNAFVAEVLPENAAMLRVFQRSGLAMHETRDGGVVHVTLQLG
jgi:RimJ/RimL family protein N-acetyltransferase